MRNYRFHVPTHFFSVTTQLFSCTGRKDIDKNLHIDVRTFIVEGLNLTNSFHTKSFLSYLAPMPNMVSLSILELQIYLHQVKQHKHCSLLLPGFQTCASGIFDFIGPFFYQGMAVGSVVLVLFNVYYSVLRW